MMSLLSMWLERWLKFGSSTTFFPPYPKFNSNSIFVTQVTIYSN